MASRGNKSDEGRQLLGRRVAAIFFVLILVYVFGLVGFLSGNYLWSRYGPLPRDVDETQAYFFGLLVGILLAVVGGMGLLWKLWPRRWRSVDDNEMTAEKTSSAPKAS
jgi:hypothetical protein